MSSMMKRRVAALAVGALATMAVAGCSVGAGSQGGGGGETAAAYPDGPIEVVVTYAAGGASDQLARTLVPALEDELGQSVIVQNEAGGAGTVGMQSVVSAEPDGYQLGFIAGGPLTVQPHYGRTSYEHDDITPVAQVATAPLLLAVRADSPFQTIDDLVEHLEASPGDFTYASSGAGNPANIAMEKLDAEAGVDTQQVPFESSGEVAAALLGGNVDGAAGLPSAFAASVEAGEMRILANLGDVKAAFYEDVDTLEDAGYDAVTNVTNGVVAPADTPQEVVDAIAAAIEAALADADISDTISATGFVPAFAGGDEYGATLEAEYEETGSVLKELGLI